MIRTALLSRYTLLVLFAGVPILAGIGRLLQMTGLPVAMPDSDRVLSQMQPLFAAHILAGIIFTVAGAYQFSARLRRRARGFHRWSGRLSIAAALVTGVSAVWLTLAFPHAAHDGPLLDVVRAIAGLAMIGTAGAGLWAILNRNIERHLEWMLRAYAICLGTALQSFVLGIWTAVDTVPAGATRAVIFAGSWITCVLVAETRHRRNFSFTRKRQRKPRLMKIKIPTATGLMLSHLWLFSMLNMLFRDVHELTMADTIAEISSGRLNGVEVTEGLLLGGALIVELLMLGMLLSRILPPQLSRVMNLVLAPIAILGTIAANPSDPDDYFFAAIEIAAFCAIFVLAWTWRPSEQEDAGWRVG